MIDFNIGKRHYKVIGNTSRLCDSDIIIMQTKAFNNDRACLWCKYASSSKKGDRCLRQCLFTDDLDNFVLREDLTEADLRVIKHNKLKFVGIKK